MGPSVEPRPRGQAARSHRWILEIAETVLLTLAIFLGVQTFITQPYQIEQHSMETTLLPGQYVLVDKLTPHWAPYIRGDVVVIRPPAGEGDGNGTPFIKRVIGVAGDRIDLQDGKVLVNGTQLDEPYLFEEDGKAQPTEPQTGTSSWSVADGQLFVLGDHRAVSEDSRTFGLIPIDSVIGRAWLRYWPLSAFGVLQHPTYVE